MSIAGKVIRLAYQRSDLRHHLIPLLKTATSVPGLVVGDILSASWGYGQTGVEFYQVTALKGKQMVELRQISSKPDPQKPNHVLPVPNSFTGPPLRKIPHQGVVRIDSVRRAFKWDGRSEYETPHPHKQSCSASSSVRCHSQKPPSKEP